MGLNNPLYDKLLLHKPSRERIAQSMFGARTITNAIPSRQANVDAIFDAAPSARAAMEGRISYDDYPRWVLGGGGTGLSGGIGLGGLPDPHDIIGVQADPGGGAATVLGENDDGKLWADGLGPGNPYVTDFKGKYAYAQKVSAMADDFAVGTPIRTQQKRLDDELIDAMARVGQAYHWDRVCTQEWDRFKNCRTAGQVDKLKTALANVRDALNKYSAFELAITKAPPEWRSDYIDYGSGTTSTTTGARTADTANELAFGTRTSSRGASTASGSGLPGWALPVGGVVLLGMLAGGLYFLKKK